MRCWLCLACGVALALAPGASGQEGEPSTRAGHSRHGAAFNEGPRQRATRLQGTGEVRFRATTEHAEASAFIDQGLGLVHGFSWVEAERAFRQAAALDPACAAAYWGMALANQWRVDRARARGFIAAARRRLAQASPREQAFIRALAAWLEPGAEPGAEQARRLAYDQALAAIASEHDCIEAMALRAVHRYESGPYIKIDADLIEGLCRQVLAHQPNHPAHHYRVHIWDLREPARALDSAARCGQAAPGVPHMWHMPAHIYYKLHRYGDAVWHMRASARAENSALLRERSVLPDQLFNYAHNHEWMIRALSYVGAVDEAVAVAKMMIALPRHPRWNHLGLPFSSAAYGRRRLLKVLEAWEAWEALLEVTDSPAVPPTDDAVEQARWWRARALALAHLQRREPAEAAARELRQRRPAVARRIGEVAEAARARATELKLDGKAIDFEVTLAQQKPKELLERIDAALIELETLALLSAGKHAHAAVRLRGGGQVNKIPSERRVRLFLHSGQERRALLGARAHAKRHPGKLLPLLSLAHIADRVGDHRRRDRALDAMRAISAELDRFDRRPLRRVARAIAARGWPQDWRQAPPLPKDLVGAPPRPPLERLGPARWQGWRAPGWTLLDGDGQARKLADLRGGKPAIVIFYLGHRCVHCTEQLNAFKPLTAAFAEAGIRLLAISSDDAEGLQASLGGGGYPFPLLSDPKLEVFKAYRCHDDFEQLALHGTFLLDAEGVVRWFDIGPEPFMEGRFLLREARRLLAR